MCAEIVWGGGGGIVIFIEHGMLDTTVWKKCVCGKRHRIVNGMGNSIYGRSDW